VNMYIMEFQEPFYDEWMDGVVDAKGRAIPSPLSEISFKKVGGGEKGKAAPNPQPEILFKEAGNSCKNFFGQL